MTQKYKYLHIRACEFDGEICNKGGLTLAYLVSPEMGAIFLHWAKCHPSDNFCYQIGRELASKRLFEDGPAEVLELTHPVSETLREWIQFSLYSGDIELMQESKRHRWLCTFSPDIPVDYNEIGV